MAKTQDAIAAARRMRGYLANRGEVVPGGVVLWTEDIAGEWKASALELSEDLQVLGVPHYTTITRRMQPPWRTPQTKLPPARWEKIWITGDDFAYLVQAIPSARRLDPPPLTGPPMVAIKRRRDGSAFYAVGDEQLARIVGLTWLDDSATEGRP
jgi:hypothetical protein